MHQLVTSCDRAPFYCRAATDQQPCVCSIVTPTLMSGELLPIPLLSIPLYHPSPGKFVRSSIIMEGSADSSTLYVSELLLNTTVGKPLVHPGGSANSSPANRTYGSTGRVRLCPSIQQRARMCGLLHWCARLCVNSCLFSRRLHCVRLSPNHLPPT